MPRQPKSPILPSNSFPRCYPLTSSCRHDGTCPPLSSSSIPLVSPPNRGTRRLNLVGQKSEGHKWCHMTLCFFDKFNGRRAIFITYFFVGVPTQPLSCPKPKTRIFISIIIIGLRTEVTKLFDHYQQYKGAHPLQLNHNVISHPIQHHGLWIQCKTVTYREPGLWPHPSRSVMLITQENGQSWLQATSTAEFIDVDCNNLAYLLKIERCVLCRRITHLKSTDWEAHRQTGRKAVTLNANKSNKLPITTIVQKAFSVDRYNMNE